MHVKILRGKKSFVSEDMGIGKPYLFKRKLNKDVYKIMISLYCNLCCVFY